MSQFISGGKSGAGDRRGQAHRPKRGVASRVGRRGCDRQLSQLEGRGGRSRLANRGDGQARAGDSGGRRQSARK